MNFPAPSASPLTKKIARILLLGAAAVAALAALGHLGLLYYIFSQRLTYPLDIEWMEGGMLGHALRLMQGRQIYAPPSVDFISYLYTPFYPLLLALLGKIFGLSYFLGRLVSLLSFSSALGLMGLIIYHQVSDRKLALLCTLVGFGLLASTFPHTEAWFDLVRNDSLFLALTVGNLYLLIYRHHHWPSLIAAALFAVLAFFTKQTGTLFIFFSGAILLWLCWRRLPIYVALVGILLLGLMLLLNWSSHGWFWQYVYKMHQGHDLYWSRIWPQSELKMFKVFPVPALLLGLWLFVSLLYFLLRRQFTDRDRANLFWFLATLIAVAVGAIGFATQWAEENAYIPAYFFAALFSALALADIAEKLGELTRRALAGAIVALLCAGALTAQLAQMYYSPRPHLPTAEHRVQARQLLDTLARQTKDVLMPYHPYYPVLVGKNAYYHQMGTNDISRAGFAFPSTIIQAVGRQGFGAILLDTPPGERYDFIYGQYKLAQWFSPSTMPPTYTGYIVRPTYLFVPQQIEPLPSGTRMIFDFEQGTYAGWQIEGTAFGPAPISRPPLGQGPLGPYQGRYLVSSAYGGDFPTGRALSPEFLLDKPELSYRIGGGQAPGRLVVRLLVDGQIVYEATGSNSDLMELRQINLAQHLGKKARLELIDNETGSWGHLLFDELMLRDK